MEVSETQISFPKPLSYSEQSKAAYEGTLKALKEFHCIKKVNYSKKDFAAKIGKSTSFVDQERRAGRLEWKQVGGTVAIPATELQKYT